MKLSLNRAVMINTSKSLTVVFYLQLDRFLEEYLTRMNKY